MLPEATRPILEPAPPAPAMRPERDTDATVGPWIRLRAWIRQSRTWAVVVRWYFALLLLSMGAKYASTQWGDVLNIPITHPGMLGRMEHFARWTRRVFLVYRADVIETWLVVAVILLLGRGIARIRLNVLAWVSLAAAVLVSFACWLALSQTGVPLTHGTVLIGLQWGWEHPDVIPTIAPLSQIAIVLGVAVVYGGLPVATTSPRARPAWLSPITRRTTQILTIAAPVLLLLVLLTPGRLTPAFTSTMSPTEGYWSSTFVALADVDRESPVNLAPPTRAALDAAYARVAYPLGRPSDASLIAAVPAATTARHVVIVVLETAPRAYYPLATDPTLPAFSAMAERAIVSEHHLTTRTYTLLAIYGILTGTYPRPGSPIGEFGAFRNDGLAATLGARGYETSYIDSYKVDWGYHYRAELQQQGFATILDTAGFRPMAADPFDVAVAREHWSFRQALHRIDVARQHRTGSLVVVATTLGHFPWRAPSALAGTRSTDKLRRITHELDGAVGEFLHGLDSLGVRDSTIVVVTGDHGLRYKAEFDSFAGDRQPPDVDFNVPFMLYAPGQIARRIELPYPTSHVDVAPTIYALLGVEQDSLMLHGENMLDARLAHRATFLMNTGLNPNDGFVLEGHRFTSNVITHEVRSVPAIAPAERLGPHWSDANVPALLDAANHVFNLTAAYFLAARRNLVASQP